MREIEVAEGYTALAVGEVVEMFPLLTAEQRAVLMQRLRAPIFSAVLSAMMVGRKVIRRKTVSLKPSKN